MTSEIRNNLRSRGILLPGDNSRGCLQNPTDKPQDQNPRPRRALINTRNSDLRWPVGRSGKREVPYEITPSNCKYFLILLLFLKIPTSSDLKSRKKIVDPKILFLVGIPYDGLYGETPPERGTSFRLQVYERVGISLVEVYERVDCKTVRIFAYSSKLEQSNERSGTRLKTESETGESFFSLASHARLARFARVRLLRHALPISLLILRRKKPTVLQSNERVGKSVIAICET